ncbi:alpha hydrolase [Halovenus sp. WSH3]|uniref:Alpha hydrolase n=1 Tax=Halovenus carboxidivorans TaxID=2692199 RepID=A0A6B0T4X9_9EURY|nr:alpha hydrolase [Halovenus carboxidivorans]MXR52017.1 alpha hydrolase [Halovenus carboxidivorans]
MEVGLLSSGGKDSTLAALLLDGRCDLTLLCCSFGITDDYEHAIAAAEAAGFEARRVDLDPDVAREAVAEMVDDGYPRNGIQRVHEHALERAAALDFDGIADGTRRDDRVPTVPRSLAQSIEDRYGVDHLAPLAGIGRGAIDQLAEEHLVVETGPSEEIEKGDYESELRAVIAEEHGGGTVAEIFPEHTQSRVVGRR